MSDDELLMIAGAGAAQRPFGVSGPAEVDGVAVFLKRLPLTDLEASRPRSTRNHFGLPTYYSYGVGSGGLGACRELAAHEMVDGRALFPRLLHQRVMPRTVGPAPAPWSEEEYVRYWNGSAAVARFMRARQTSSQEIWVVLEHVPHEVMSWLPEHQEQVEEVLAQLFDAIAALRSLG